MKNTIKKIIAAIALSVAVIAPVTICGNIHGQLDDLFQLFETAGGVGTDTYLFMGDYVDHGHFSIETVSYLAALKLKYPTKFYLLRGHHECRAVNQMYGFYNECVARYGHRGIWTLCNDVFDLLPMQPLPCPLQSPV